MPCTVCGTSLPPEARFCPSCGAPQDERLAEGRGSSEDRESFARLRRYIPEPLIQRILETRGRIEGERRVVTVLFADTAGSTALGQRLPPDMVRVVFDRLLDLLARKVIQYEGTVARFMGDGLLAFFGAPLAHEDDPLRAARTALEMQEAVGAYSQEVERDVGLPLGLRVGLHTGLVVVGEVGSDLRLEYTAMGDTVNLASRLEGAAEPGSVLVSEETYRHLKPYVEAAPEGPFALKGVEEPVKAWRVTGLREVPGKARGIEGLHAPLVGRGRELERLRRAMADLAVGRGQIVIVTGEAGLGKSRLAEELRTALPPGVRRLAGHCLSYGRGLSLHPFVEMLRAQTGIESADGSLSREVKLRRSLEAIHGRVPPEALAPLGSLLGVRSEGPGEATTAGEALVGFVERLARTDPVLLVLDDLHWADDSSLDVLRNLLPVTDRAALGLLLLLRPETDHPSWALVEHVRREYPHRLEEVRLSPLDEEESSELVDHLLHIAELPESLRLSILAKAEGNPFFVEEVIRSLIDEGRIGREGGRWRAAAGIEQVAVPDSLQAVLQARFDRLDLGSRELLQAASVLGRSFPEPVIAHMVGNGAALQGKLATLLRRELIREERRFPQAEFSFKHVLVQEVAYSTLVEDRRRTFHLEAARALERFHEGQLEEAYATLARHYHLASQVEQARHYAELAGDRSMRLHAFGEAVRHYELAIELAGPDPALEGRLRSKLADALGGFSRYPEAIEQAERAVPLCRAAGDWKRLARAYVVGAVVRWQVGRLRESVGWCYQGLEALQSGPDLPEVGHLYHQVARAETFLGNQDRAAEMVEKALQQAERHGDDELRAQALNTRGLVEIARRRIDAGLASLKEALAVAREGQQRWASQRACVNLSALLQDLSPDPAEAIRYAELGLELLGDAQNPEARSYLLENLATALLHCGRLDEALPVAEETARIDRQTRSDHLIGSLTALGMYHLMHGDWDQAEALFEEASRHAVATDNLQYVGGADWGRMQLALHRENFAAAYELLRRHLEAVERYGNSGWELQEYALLAISAARLGRLEEAEGYVRRARELLPVLEGFSVVGFGHRADGVLADAAGDGEARDRAFAAAVEAFRPRPYDRALALADWAERLARGGQAEAAREHYREALALFEGMGAERQATRVRQALAEL